MTLVSINLFMENVFFFASKIIWALITPGSLLVITRHGCLAQPDRWMAKTVEVLPLSYSLIAAAELAPCRWANGLSLPWRIALQPMSHYP
jgi:hypothetical protein